MTINKKMNIMTVDILKEKIVSVLEQKDKVTLDEIMSLIGLETKRINENKSLLIIDDTEDGIKFAEEMLGILEEGIIQLEEDDLLIKCFKHEDGKFYYRKA